MGDEMMTKCRKSSRGRNASTTTACREQNHGGVGTGKDSTLPDEHRASTREDTNLLSTSKSGNTKLVYVPEEDMNDFVNPCTGEVEPPNTIRFDYWKFTEINRLQTLLGQLERSSMKFVDPTATSLDSLKEMFVRRYGPVDFDARLMRERLHEMQEALMEQETLCPVDIQTKLLDENVEIPGRFLRKELLQAKLHHQYQSDELTMYTVLDPAFSYADWFLVPRRKLREIREEHLNLVQVELLTNSSCEDANSSSTTPESGPIDAFGLSVDDSRYYQACDVKSWVMNGQRATTYGGPATGMDKAKNDPVCSGKYLPTTAQNETWSGTDSNGELPLEQQIWKDEANDVNEVGIEYDNLTSLHVYDPKFEYCYEKPYRIFCSEKQDAGSVIPTLVSAKIMEHLNAYPNGVDMVKFWEDYHNKYGKFPATSDNSQTLLDLIHRHRREIYYVDGGKIGLPKLIFPGYVKGLTTPDLILRRIWHFVMCLMGQKPFYLVEDVFPEITARHGFDFNPQHWGFTRVPDFLNFCITRFGLSHKVCVQNVTSVVDRATSTKIYVAINSAHITSQLERVSGLVRSSSPKLQSPIPKGFMTLNDPPIHSWSDAIYQNEMCLVMVHTVLTPHSIHVVLAEKNKQLLLFRDSFREKDRSTRLFNQQIPDPAQLKPGLYVMVHFKWGKWDATWYRGRILSKEPDTNLFKVYGIDFGFRKNFELEMIRYMPIGDLSQPVSFAIPVKLEINLPVAQTPNCKWDDDMFDVLDAVMPVKCHLLARFLAETYDQELGCKIWTIDCQVWMGNKCLYKSLSDSIVAMYTKKKEDRRNRSKSKKKSTATPSATTSEAAVVDSTNQK